MVFAPLKKHKGQPRTLKEVIEQNFLIQKLVTNKAQSYHTINVANLI